MSCSDLPEYDIELYSGDDKTLKFRYKTSGAAIDITSYEIELECSSPELAKMAVIADQTTNTGEYSFVYVPADTIGLEVRRVKYEVVFWPTGLTGTKQTMYRGSILITPERVL